MKSTKEILSFAFPAIVENFLQMFMQMVDTFLLARISLSAVAGVALAGNIITVYQAIFIALAAVLSSLLARAWARNEGVQALLKSGLKLTLLVCLALGLLSIFGSGLILSLLGARGTVLADGGLYLRLVGGLIILLGLMTSLAAFLRAKGDTKTPMNANLLANGLNIIFSASLIFGLHLGVLGAATGTILARLIGTLYLYYKCQKLDMKLSLRHFWRAKISPEVLRLTGPATGERLVMRLGDLVVIALIISFGAKVYAGNAIGENITQFNYMPAFGMATATVIFVAQALGGKELHLVQAIVRKIYWLSIAMMTGIGLILLLASDLLGRLFTSDPTALAANQTVILFSFLATAFTAGTLIYTAAFQGLGNTRLPFLTTTIGMLGVRVVLGFLLGYLLGLGLTGVWLAVLLDNLFRFVFLKVRLGQFIRKSEHS